MSVAPPSSRPVALVTGAARGIGLAITEKFLSEGWCVALLDCDGATLKAAHARLDAANTMALEADVSAPQTGEEAVAAVLKRFGRLDCLVNNAGIAIFKPVLETSLEEWNRVLAVNLTGPFLMSQAAAPALLEQRGSIIHIASISGLRASTLRVAYGTSKAGLIQLMKQQAAELGARGVRVNAIAPGPVDTAMAKAVHSPAIRAAYRDHVPLERYGTEEEIAAAVFFLASPAASYVNGQVLAVDGGFDSTGIGLPALRGEA